MNVVVFFGFFDVITADRHNTLLLFLIVININKRALYSVNKQHCYQCGQQTDQPSTCTFLQHAQASIQMLKLTIVQHTLECKLCKRTFKMFYSVTQLRILCLGVKKSEYGADIQGLGTDNIALTVWILRHRKIVQFVSRLYLQQSYPPSCYKEPCLDP